jgi:hypothetical protein
MATNETSSTCDKDGFIVLQYLNRDS